MGSKPLENFCSWFRIHLLHNHVESFWTFFRPSSQMMLHWSRFQIERAWWCKTGIVKQIRLWQNSVLVDVYVILGAVSIQLFFGNWKQSNMIPHEMFDKFLLQFCMNFFTCLFEQIWSQSFWTKLPRHFLGCLHKFLMPNEILCYLYIIYRLPKLMVNILIFHIRFPWGRCREIW